MRRSALTGNAWWICSLALMDFGACAQTIMVSEMVLHPCSLLLHHLDAHLLQCIVGILYEVFTYVYIWSRMFIGKLQIMHYIVSKVWICTHRSHTWAGFLSSPCPDPVISPAAGAAGSGGLCLCFDGWITGFPALPEYAEVAQKWRVMMDLREVSLVWGWNVSRGSVGSAWLGENLWTEAACDGN